MSDGSPPRRAQRTIVIFTATTTPTARSSPYTWSVNGPSVNVPSVGLGMDAITAPIVGGPPGFDAAR